MTEELDLITEEPVTPPPEVGPRRVGRRSGAHLVKNVEINDSIVFGKDFIAPVYNQKGMEQFYEISGRNGSTFCHRPKKLLATSAKYFRSLPAGLREKK